MLAHEFKFKPSKQYLILLLITVFSSTVVVVCLPVSFWVKLLLLGLLCLYGANIIWKFGLLRSKTAVLGVILQSEGLWHIYIGKQSYPAKLMGNSTVTGFVSILRFQVLGSFWPKSCVVFSDSVDSDHYRQLLVLLRMS